MFKKMILTLLATVPAVAAMAQPCCAQFDGFYIGGNIGWSHDDYQFEDLDNFAHFIDDDLKDDVRIENDNAILGVQIGYNWQPCCTLIGIEADWNWVGHRHKHNNITVSDNEDPADTLRIRHDVHFLGTVRGRAGVVVDNMLLYGTAGFAYAHAKDRFVFNDGDLIETDSFRHNRFRYGGVVGFGAEWACGCNWSIKAEALWIVFGQNRKTFTSSVIDPGETYRFQTHDHMTIARIGFNYRFNLSNCCGW